MKQQNLSHNCKDELNEVELRATPARIAVMELLEKTNLPVDATMIKDHLEKNHIDTDPATVFRILNMFLEKGLIKQISLNESKLRYELANREDHHHLICQQCGNIEDISECAISELEHDIQKKKGFTVLSHSLEFYGVCHDCQKAQKHV